MSGGISHGTSGFAALELNYKQGDLMSENKKSRIDHLIQPSALDGKHLVVVGLGSGGFRLFSILQCVD